VGVFPRGLLASAETLARVFRLRTLTRDNRVTIVCGCLSSGSTHLRRNVGSCLPSPDSHSRQSGDHRLWVSFLGAYSPPPKRWLASSASGLSLATIVTIVCGCLSSVPTRLRRNVGSCLPPPDSHSRQSGDHRLWVSFLGAYSPPPKRWLASSASGLSLAISLQLCLLSHP
jgi:hypothetical protein